eukprot:SAG31_NODE_6404_length_2031_cov_9.252070_1_plen_123_part_10
MDGSGGGGMGGSGGGGMAGGGGPGAAPSCQPLAAMAPLSYRRILQTTTRQGAVWLVTRLDRKDVHRAPEPAERSIDRWVLRGLTPRGRRCFSGHGGHRTAARGRAVLCAGHRGRPAAAAAPPR